MKWLCTFLAIALSPPLSADTQPAHFSSDPQVIRARTLVESGRYPEALEILRPLAGRHEDAIDVGFLIGLAATEAARRRTGTARAALLDEAVAAYHALLVAHPQLTRIRLELARALFLKGEDSLAREHFERVLAGDPPPAMAVNIRRFLHTMRARRRWSGYFSINIEENDNLNRGTETETLYLFGLPFTVSEGSRPRGGRGVALAAGSEYQYPWGAQRRWRFAVDGAHHQYPGDESDQFSLTLRSGPRWLLGRRTDISVQGVGERVWVADDRYSAAAGLRADGRRRITPNLGMHGRVAWREIQYRAAALPDTAETDFTVGADYLFTPLLQGHVTLGYTEERPRGADTGYGRRISAGLSGILPKGWTVGASYEYAHQRRSDFVPFSPGERQRDRKRTQRPFALNRGLTLGGFSPQLTATREHQQSNAPLDEYRRTRWDLRLVRQF